MLHHADMEDVLTTDLLAAGGRASAAGFVRVPPNSFAAWAAGIQGISRVGECSQLQP